MIKAPIALGVYLSGVMTNSSMSSSRKSSITTPPTANNPGMLIVVWDHRNDIKCSHSLSEVPRRGPWRTPEEQVHPIVPSSYSVKVYRLPVVSAGTCTCLIIFREPIISQSPLHLARIHRWTGMDGVRTAEGGEGVTGAMIRARIWVDGRLAGGLQALLGAPMAAYSGCGERDGGIGHGKRRSRTGLARVCGDVGLAGGSVADGRRQAGSGMARSRARARLNWSSQGQRRGRCRVNRRAERVIRPAKAKTRRLRVLVVTIC